MPVCPIKVVSVFTDIPARGFGRNIGLTSLRELIILKVGSLAYASDVLYSGQPFLVGVLRA